MSEVVRRTSLGLPDSANLQEARARWLGELAVQKSMLSQTRQGCKKHERAGSANLRCRKVCSHGLADPANLQEARERWLGELAVQESKLAQVRKHGYFARGTSEVAWRTCRARKYARTGYQTRQLCKRHEQGGSANLWCRKVNPHGLPGPPRLQEARARWHGELAVQENKLARTRQGFTRQERASSANLRCKNVNSHRLADPVRLQEPRARWLAELAVLESNLARVSSPGNVARGTSGVARRTCGAGK
ncbi:hypothetical protein CDL15_Pgr002723 [Punica granatum]|uniref:Uncharacterized protein n=1 Tax=Punica granatum TaxID=22663 RepID=A0A218XGN7_PUNGR|nr:hypothetical protein CDL15_Pgr002723 [Punica granatum]